MTKELGLFPLNLVAFPGEKLNLHVFEPRYKQLINDCLEKKCTFGIPSYVNNRIEYGTEMEILEITKTYKDGRMDIRTKGILPIRVVKYENPWKDRLYAGGLIEELRFDDKEDGELKIRSIDLLQDLFSWLNLDKKISVERGTPLHEYVHKIGLTAEEEHELLIMQSEKERQLFILEHLKKVLPILERAEVARKRINLNGHFKNLDPLNF